MYITKDCKPLPAKFGRTHSIREGIVNFKIKKKVLVEFIEQEEAGCYLNPFDKTRRKE